jgi:hypothetical protein
VWHYAAEEGFTILSKDADFHERSFLLGHPPKVIWIRRGNCSTDEVLSRARNRCHEGADADATYPSGDVDREIRRCLESGHGIAPACGDHGPYPAPA